MTLFRLEKEQNPTLLIAVDSSLVIKTAVDKKRKTLVGVMMTQKFERSYCLSLKKQYSRGLSSY